MMQIRETFELHKRLIIALLVGVILIILAVLSLYYIFSTKGNTKLPSQVTLEYWTLFEETSTMEPLIRRFEEDFNAQNPKTKLTINVTNVERNFQSLSDYKDAVQTRFQKSSKSPVDIARINNSWLIEMSGRLAPAPDQIVNGDIFNSDFITFAANSSRFDGKILTMPLMMDSLMLVMNKDIFQKEGINMPKPSDSFTWNDFRTLAKSLTKRNGEKITQAGAAIGLGTNIDHSTDILGLIMAQNGVKNIFDPNTDKDSLKRTTEAINYYTSLQRVDKVWDESFRNSSESFLNGQVAMTLVPSWRINDFLGRNRDINIATSTVPQLPSTSQGDRQDWGSVWGEAVNLNSQYPDIAWSLLKFLGEEDSMKQLYANQTRFRNIPDQSLTFGAPYTRSNLLNTLSTHGYLSPLVLQAGSSNTWLALSFAGNTKHTKILEDLINQSSKGTIREDDVADGLNTIIANIRKLQN